ncbi:hypothetical protein BT69DRAFT_1223652 [Atractiella rhizophila]|nr:hypothetical protein BT69DRAFT_1223652 [Atractiella rhizophila]
MQQNGLSAEPYYLPPPPQHIPPGMSIESIYGLPPTTASVSAWQYPLGSTPYGSTLPYGQDEYDSDDEVKGKVSVPGKQAAARRWKAVEDAERRVWMAIARKEIPKVWKLQTQSETSKKFFCKRVGTIVSREARKAQGRTKVGKEIQTRAKKVGREMGMFWRGNEKREREARKKAEKEMVEKARKEEEVREAKRQARKLNFLITQTELYSHFVGSKMRTKEAEESTDTAGAGVEAVTENKEGKEQLEKILENAKDDEKELEAIDFDNADDESNLNEHARRNALNAVQAARAKAAEFDAAAKQTTATVVDKAAASTSADILSGINIDSDELNFQNPSSFGSMEVKQPKMLQCQLKEYQLKGLNWLANLYEQGINGILADEMGLGKTVQSISLLGYLAEVHNIWGPFLVIAPASTLHNWQQEITRFVPSLKALPYWGNSKDRATLRKFWNRKQMRYDKDAPFHVLVTSYQLVVQDEKYFQRVKWQYMVLDEAQAIKSSSSARWKTLLGFHCRNRLLLTGTPIQNSMQELWALLHFIMPSLFDSHDEFSEWFSKDIENSAENKGAMNEHQLRRLHMILKPFMLRRIKKNVQNELGEKIELDVMCELTPRQKLMYRTLRQNISLSDLMQRATVEGSDDSVSKLMNLIMQFRKVCNHPELFERGDVKAPFALAEVPFTNNINLEKSGDLLDVPYASRSAIRYTLPKLLVTDAVDQPSELSRTGFDTLYLRNLMNIWSSEYLKEAFDSNDSSMSFLRILDASPSETKLAVSGSLPAIFSSMKRDHDLLEDADLVDVAIDHSLRIFPKSLSFNDIDLPRLNQISDNSSLIAKLTRLDIRSCMPAVVAPPIEVYASDQRFLRRQQSLLYNDDLRTALYGVPAPSLESEEAVTRLDNFLPGAPIKGTIGASSPDQYHFPLLRVPHLMKLILDSGKLARLDKLLHELKGGGHRVLIYFQMTKMIDLMEEYLSFRHYRYLRLDGSSTISERRDMVMDWQTRPDIFIFLLSTRAGGLGINLTAADTVVFYDSDWNPSNDSQAMDRAHRLGQTKQVTVYRLITKGTIDERIVQLARTKKSVQDAVVGSSSQSYSEVAKPNEVVSLLLGDDEMEESIRKQELRRTAAMEKAVADGKKGARTRQENKRARAEKANEGLVGSGILSGAGFDEGDDFFAPSRPLPAPDEEDMSPVKEKAPKKKTKKRKAHPDDGDEPEPKRKKGPKKKKVVEED